MKVLEFTYTKPNGEVTKRAVVETIKPNKYVCGFDISEMDSDTMVEFAKEYNALEAQFAEARLALQAQFDIKHNFRQFDPERMTEVTSDYI